MSRTLIALALISISGALTTGTAVAGDVDAHERARERIAPALNYAPAPRGAMGRLIGTDTWVDGQVQAQRLIRAETSPTMLARDGATTVVNGDSHQRARAFIVGHD